MTTDPADLPKMIEVAEGFHVRQEIDNIAWIDMGDWLLVIDALERRELKDEVLGAVADAAGDKPVRFLINTHSHGDHVALNAAFAERFGTEIVNQRTDPIGPEGRWLEGTRRRAQALHMPGCHTPDDIVVWIPDDKAVFVGDIFGWGLIPLTRVLNEETAGLLVDTHNRLIELGAETVIPGHGPLCTSAELRRWVEYFHWLRGTISAACAAGKTNAQIVEQTTPPEDMVTWWRFLLWKHADSVNKVLRAVRSGVLSG